MNEIYLDEAATTKVSSVAMLAVAKVLSGRGFNPSSQYAAEERQIINEAAEIVADFIGATAEEIYFTSGATESNNWAIRGWVDAQDDNKCHVISTPIEHPSVYNTIQNLPRNVCRKMVMVDEFGSINYSDYVTELLYATPPEKWEPVLVSIGLANNEVGIIQDIKKIAHSAHMRDPRIIVHTDATQALPHMKIDVNQMGIDMLSASGHKFGCPKGIGFLYIRKGVKIKNLMYGGRQQGSKRPGTENIAYIHALGQVIKHRTPNQFDHVEYNKSINKYCRYYLEDKMREAGYEVFFNSHPEHCIPVISITIKGIVANELLTLLSEQGVYISAGSACSSGTNMPSRVLTSIGLTDDEARSTIRISGVLHSNIADFTEKLLAACRSYKLLNS